MCLYIYIFILNLVLESNSINMLKPAYGRSFQQWLNIVDFAGILAILKNGGVVLFY